MTTANTLNLDEINAKLDRVHPAEIVRWASETFGEPKATADGPAAGGLIMTSSFGAESMCSIHLAISVVPRIKIVVVNTGYLFAETLSFMQEMRKRFDLNVIEYHTKNDPVVWLTVHGEPDPRVRKNVDACCAANKNEVFDRAMRELAPAGWLRGVRADQSSERGKMQVVQWSKRYNCYAISPILRWSSRDIWQYMKEHDLPYHPLWEKGYVSIGCNPSTCTAPVGEEGDQRSGRWAGTGKKECGIHLEPGDGGVG